MLFWKGYIGQSRQEKLFESGQAKDTLKQVSLNSGLEPVVCPLPSTHFLQHLFIGQNVNTGKRCFWSQIQLWHEEWKVAEGQGK